MKNKLTYLILTFISFSNLAYSEVCDAYPYVSVGVGPAIIIPNVGIGYRARYEQLGWDTSLSFSTIGYAHQLTGQLVGHYYLNPQVRNSAYVGLGVMGSGIITNRSGGGWTLSPDFVFGKVLESAGKDHFIEMHVGIPTIVGGHPLGSRHSTRALYLPLMYIKYGMAF